MTIQYAVNLWNSTIHKAEVSRETEHNLWLAPSNTRGERKVHKGSSHMKFFGSFSLAHSFLLKKKETMVRVKKLQFAQAEDELKAVKAMKEPE